MKQPLVSRPAYGAPRTPRAEAKLPSGGPSDHGLPLDDSVPGYSTFNKPTDDNGTNQEEQPRKDIPLQRNQSPRDVPKARDRIDIIDQTDAQPHYMGLGKPSQSPKTKYPYRDNKPNTTNASYIPGVTGGDCPRCSLRAVLDPEDECPKCSFSYAHDQAEFVAGLWALQTAPERLLVAGETYRVAATIETLRGGLNPKIQQRAKSCTATLKRADVKNMRWIFAVDCGHGAKTVRFKAARPGNITKFHKMDMHVACSCPAWRWQGPEYHATTKDFQDPKTKLQGTASAPDIRDPERQNMICKHVAAVLSFTSQWTIPKSR